MAFVTTVGVGMIVAANTTAIGISEGIFSMRNSIIVG
jgi:hypothetical protein